MHLIVRCVFKDGAMRPVRDDFAGLLEAARYALRLADRHGTDPGDGHGPPDMIQVVSGGIVHLSVKVLAGGLDPKARLAPVPK